MKMDREKAKMEMEKAHEVSAPVDTLARRIKAASLFPSIYEKQKTHRSFPKMKTVGADGDNELVKMRKKNVVGFNN